MGGLDRHLGKRAAALAAETDLPWDAIDGATVLVTGATGLVGSQLVRVLLARPAVARVVVPVRDVERAHGLLGDEPRLTAIPWSAGEPLTGAGPVDYVVHGAAPTASRTFVEQPVEVVRSIVDGAIASLELARESAARKAVLLSTMEIYGEAFGTIDETTFGPVDPMAVRSSYPEAKRAAESLYAAYASEYAVPACVLRLAQCFGEGVADGDGRAFAEFGRCALAGRDIVLLTDGSKRNARISVDDAIRAILVALARGVLGEAYNAANEGTYGSVVELAQTAIDTLGEGTSAIRFEIDDRSAQYPPTSDLRLDSSKLRALGWTPHDSLEAMFTAMAEGWAADGDQPPRTTREMR